MPVLKELSQRYGFKGDDDYAKIEIETLIVVRSFLKPKELKQALKIVEDNQDYLMQKWIEIVVS